MFKPGSIALVTGASSGIGQAIAIDLAKNGVKVLINYCRSEEGALETLKIIEENGGSGEIIQCDVSDAAEALCTLVRQEGQSGNRAAHAGACRSQHRPLRLARQRAGRRYSGARTGRRTSSCDLIRCQSD